MGTQSRLGGKLEAEIATPDHNAFVAGSCTSSGENLHRQVKNLHLSIRSSMTKNCFWISCRGLTDESEILKFLQHGTLVGLLPVPHPILIRKYQANSGTSMWFRTYMWGIIYLR
jgi:hypothetical protein